MSAIAALLLALIGTDRLGDPTPPGVIVRYGTARMCVEDGHVRNYRVHPTRDRIFSTGFERPVLGWDLPSGKECFRQSFGQDKGVYCDIRFDPAGRFRLMFRSPRFDIWDDTTGRLVRTGSYPANQHETDFLVVSLMGCKR